MAPFDYVEGGMADMAKFLGKRLLSALVTIFLLSIIIFTISHMSKGDPAQIILGAKQQRSRLPNSGIHLSWTDRSLNSISTGYSEL